MENKPNFVPYEANHRIRPLLLVTTIVNQGQGDAVAAIAHQNEAFFTIIHHGRGTAPRDFYAFSPSAVPKKEIVFTVLRADKWPVFRGQLKERFSVSAIAKGMSFAIPIDALAGVSIYKMLSNTRQFEKPVRKGTHIKKEKRKDEK